MDSACVSACRACLRSRSQSLQVNVMPSHREGVRSSLQAQTKPPSTGNATPVMNDDSSLARKSAVFAISVASPQRFMGTLMGGG